MDPHELTDAEPVNHLTQAPLAAKPVQTGWRLRQRPHAAPFPACRSPLPAFDPAGDQPSDVEPSLG